MSTIVDQKKDVFGSLAALKVVTGNQMPKLPDFNSFGSINNSTNSSQFLIDLIKTLDGAGAIKDIVIDTIVYRLPDIETAIKDGLKKQLKEMVSCSVNPTIPEWFKNGGTGVEMKISDIDFYDMMKVAPTTTEGNVIYTDIPPQTNSKDFNTYLYYTVQDQGNPNLWGSNTSNSNIIETEFSTTGAINNNILKFTTSAEYSDKKLPEFNGDYIDSLTLFGEPDSIDSSTFITLYLKSYSGQLVLVLEKVKDKLRKS